MPDRKKSIQGNWNFALTVKSMDSKREQRLVEVRKKKV